MNPYETISDYLAHITEAYNIRIVINDFINFINLDKKLSEVLQPYMIHSNLFCMKIKSKKELWDQCLDLKHRILRKSEAKKDIYWGMCYCGVQEYIVPIISHHTVIGVICVGVFCANSTKSENRIKKVANAFDLDKNELINAFYQSVSTEVPNINLIKALLGIVCENLISFYKNLQPSHNAVTSQNSLLFTNEKFILYHVKEYIQQYFTEQIRVSDIADFCHCSESYVNHIFKKNTGFNIRAYINTYRMNLAKTMLEETKYSIAEISSKIGFNDPNYFTTVFSRSIGMSPTIYRKQYTSSIGKGSSL